MKISECKQWKAIPVERCIDCQAPATQKISYVKSMFAPPLLFPVCDKHFMDWVNNKLEITVPDPKKKKKEYE